MLSKLISLFSVFFNIWSAIPEPAKKKIINIIVDACDAMFRGFYKESKKQSEKEKGNA